MMGATDHAEYRGLHESEKWIFGGSVYNLAAGAGGRVERDL